MAAADVRRVVSVLGLGTMGQGIALVCAIAGYETRVFDVDAALAKNAHTSMLAKLLRMGEREKRAPEETKAIGERIVVEPDLERASATADIVIEAIVESLERKTELFERVKRTAPASALLASNTSGLSIGELGRRMGE